MQLSFHLSYHNGDHYNSVRKIGDNTQSPACIRLAAPRAEKQQDPSRKDAPSEQTAAQLEEQVMLETGVQDLQLIREVLQDYDFSKQGGHRLYPESEDSMPRQGCRVERGGRVDLEHGRDGCTDSRRRRGCGRCHRRSKERCLRGRRRDKDQDRLCIRP
uniref:Putative otu domain-containing protein n=1 Tax=Ixodes ricinus TaxID=34613 RepID=A0A0K8R3V7_IXORI